ncbi:MAG: DUF488 domain-containing protein [Chloroflexi bacterium]|nr:DUF488 domain-containing protein [Chloroflexota bacterium]
MDRAADGGRPIYTIGHSNLTLADLLARLRAELIDTVVDVRSQPVSKYSPHFNRPALADALKREGMAYSFMGDLLGGRPDSARYYDADGHVRYDLWAASPEFRKGTAMLLRAAETRRLAVLCSEADPRQCHRHLLIARVLIGEGRSPSRILHILSDGALLPEDAIPRQTGLFGGDDEWRSPQSVLHKVRPNVSSND